MGNHFGKIMASVQLGKTGLKASPLCLGRMTYGKPATGKIKPGSHAWALNEEESQHFLRQSLDLGINFFDTANVYSGGPAKRSLGDFWVHMLDAKPLSSRLRCMPRCATSRMAKASRAKKSLM